MGIDPSLTPVGPVRTDHENLIILIEHMRHIRGDVNEIKHDVDSLRRDYDTLKERVLTNGLKVGGIITAVIIFFAFAGEALKGVVSGLWLN